MGRTVVFSVVQGVELAAAVSDQSAGTVIARICAALYALSEENATVTQGVMKDGASVAAAVLREAACELTRGNGNTA